jgi:hypothetical protein
MNMAEKTKVGGETQAYCTHCRAMREHIVVAMEGSKPAKVECDVCHKQHLFRAGPPGAKSPSGRTRTARVTKKEAAPVETVDLAAVMEGRPSRGYDPKVRFAIGEVVAHPLFGKGLVTQLPGPQKVEITFPNGPRLLTHDRAALAGHEALTRPAPRTDEADLRITDAPPPKRPK